MAANIVATNPITAIAPLPITMCRGCSVRGTMPDRLPRRDSSETFCSLAHRLLADGGSLVVVPFVLKGGRYLMSDAA